ncbi:hypothetical protein E2C01_084779 [Portunus trituberculatus]|uniref:Uncharacterized protein n=1 Tax=Portunus trituberculatus TaxID=210409 RepID=A0A5B7J528_PORTR|nr:hypothetical protein [Portunus trituberculatus]
MKGARLKALAGSKTSMRTR